MNAILLAVVTATNPVCNAAVCPDVGSCLAWENDKFGMYAYGPTEFHRWSGLDTFNKSGEGTSCISWLTDPATSDFFKHPNFHDDRGTGMDNYTMGAGRGVGAVAVYGDGEWKTYTNWIESKIIHTGDDYCEFELVYPSCSLLGKMTYRITLRRGERFFRNDVSFERGELIRGDFRVGPGLDLEPKRDHKGSVVEGPGFVSIFEDPKGKDGVEGSAMSAIVVADPAEVEVLTDRQNCRVLAFKKGAFTYWAGYGWSKAGEIVTAEAWHAAVKDFAEKLKTEKKEEK